MLTIREYKQATTLEEAWQLNQKRPNRVLGGMLWMRLSKGNVQTAIDLSALGLDTIEETETEFRIGAMVSLRQLELHEGFTAYSEGANKEALRHCRCAVPQSCYRRRQCVRTLRLFGCADFAFGNGQLCGIIQGRYRAAGRFCEYAV